LDELSWVADFSIDCGCEAGVGRLDVVSAPGAEAGAAAAFCAGFLAGDGALDEDGTGRFAGDAFTAGALTPAAGFDAVSGLVLEVVGSSSANETRLAVRISGGAASLEASFEDEALEALGVELSFFLDPVAADFAGDARAPAPRTPAPGVRIEKVTTRLKLCPTLLKNSNF
jgi:hypothetical protein